jgi:trimeric autotransporter adhesin
MSARETKKERKTMQKNSNRKGLALGAVFALVSSLLVGTAPAQANENAVVIFPTTGTAAQTSMLMTETFDISLRFGTGVAASLRTYAPDTSAAFGLIITKPAGVTVSRVITGAGTNNPVSANFSDITKTEYQLAVDSSGSAKVSLGLPDRTSVSAAVAITVQSFLDVNKDGLFSAGDVLGNLMTLNFVPFSAMGTVLTLGQPVSGDSGATASFRVTEGTINWSQLNSNFTIEIKSTNDDTAATASEPVSAVELTGTSVVSTGSGAAVITKAAAYSVSATMPTAEFTASPVVESLSAEVKYGSEVIASSAVLAVQALSATGVSISPVTGPNAKLTGASAAEARFNSAFTVRAYAHSASATTSVAVATAISVSGQANLEFGAAAGVILNGVTYTTSAALAAAGFTLPAGTTTFQVSTFGQIDGLADNDTLTLEISSQLLSDDLVITFQGTALTVVYPAATVSGAAGAAKAFTMTVEDQWGEKPARTDLRVAATVALGGSTSDAVFGSVVAGSTTVTVTPVPATRTGSATVTFQLQRFDQDSQAWVNIGTTDTAQWNVFSYAAGTDAFVSRKASISASISYGVDLSWSAEAIAVKVANSFSDVVVSAPGLMIQNSDVVSQTASDTLTLNAANGQTVNVKFTARLAGTYTVTFTNGTATTTSQVVVNPARDADGATVTFDTTAIAAGSTKVITGTLRDINGNPVNTSGSATILVTYTVTGNAGIPIGTMPTETDADGEFTITVLTGANDRGTAVVSAAYYKSGAATAVADVLSFNQSIVVGGAAAPATDQKLTVGSFKGFVAIYALNYTGQKLSAKVAGKWLVENNLSRFERVVRLTGAAIPIVVDLYIDGKFVRTENIVTK